MDWQLLNLRGRLLGWKFQQELISVESEGSPEAEFLPFVGAQCFYLQPPTDWMKPTHIMEDNLLFSKSAADDKFFFSLPIFKFFNSDRIDI